MFGRGKIRHAAPDGAGNVGLGTHTVAVPVPDPDGASIYRLRALQHQIGLGMQGFAGRVVGYDQGDHISGRSLNQLITPVANPTDAIAKVGRPADAITLSTVGAYGDALATNPQLDPYQQLLYARLGRD